MSGRILVYGGAGALGRSILETFHIKGWTTYSADLIRYSAPFIDHSLDLVPNQSPKQSVESVSRRLDASLQGNYLNCVVNAAGGFMMDDIASPEFFDQLDTMWRWNSVSSFQCAALAQRYLSSDASSLLVLTGAAAAFDATPIMLSYGTSKAVVHHIIRSLAQSQCMPPRSKTIGIVPVTIDTPTNREAMPDADFNNWTQPEEFANKIFEWASGQDTQIESGELYQFETQQGVTKVTPSNKLATSLSNN